MNPQELRDTRRELNWSRADLAQRTGLTVYQIAVIEQGRRDPRENETDALQRVLRQELEHTLVETGENPVIDDVAVDVAVEIQVRSAEWNGIRRLDEVRVAGESGRFRFLFHHKDDNQEYVQVFGPVPGSVPRSRSPRAPHERSVTTDRVAPATLPRRRRRRPL